MKINQLPEDIQKYIIPAPNGTMSYRCLGCNNHYEIDELLYTCPECGNKGEVAVPYKRKKFNGMDAIVFQCGKCNAKIPVTKPIVDQSDAEPIPSTPVVPTPTTPTPTAPKPTVYKNQSLIDTEAT